MGESYLIWLHGFMASWFIVPSNHRLGTLHFASRIITYEQQLRACIINHLKGDGKPVVAMSLVS